MVVESSGNKKISARGLPMALAPKPLVRALLVLAAVVLLGTTAYFALGRGRWGIAESLYMTLITVSTVGFAELPGLEQTPGGRGVTMAVIVAGIGAIAYFQSAMTAFLVEGTLGHAWRRRRMKARIDELSGHVVVAGVGSTGRRVVEELCAKGTPFVVIDKNHEHIERAKTEAGQDILFIHGDATDDEILREAGVPRAAGIVTTLNDDKANLFVTLSARSMNATARIVARVIEPDTDAKMSRAGADATVSPNLIGGRRMAHELLRPDLTALFDEMLREGQNLRVDQVLVTDACTLVNRTVADVPPRSQADVLLLAVKDGDQLRYHPPTSFRLRRGSALVVFGEATEIEKLRVQVGAGSIAPPRRSAL